MERSYGGKPSSNGASTIEMVTLGRQEYPMIAQRHGYLRSNLGQFFSRLGEGQNLNVAELPGGMAYRLLKVFIPNFMPEYEFNGYTEEAWKKKEADERKIEKLGQEFEALEEEIDKDADAFAADEVKVARYEKIPTEVEKLREKMLTYYVEADDHSPTTDEIHDAIQAGIRVNHFDLLKHLGNFLTPQLVRGFINRQAAGLLTQT